MLPPVCAHGNTRTELRMPRTVLEFGEIVFLQFFSEGKELVGIIIYLNLSFSIINLLNAR
jgi:hypothetical protein